MEIINIDHDVMIFKIKIRFMKVLKDFFLKLESYQIKKINENKKLINKSKIKKLKKQLRDRTMNEIKIINDIGNSFLRQYISYDNQNYYLNYIRGF